MLRPVWCQGAKSGQTRALRPCPSGQLALKPNERATHVEPKVEDLRTGVQFPPPPPPPALHPSLIQILSDCSAEWPGHASWPAQPTPIQGAGLRSCRSCGCGRRTPHTQSSLFETWFFRRSPTGCRPRRCRSSLQQRCRQGCKYRLARSPALVSLVRKADQYARRQLPVWQAAFAVRQYDPLSSAHFLRPIFGSS